MFNWLKPKTDVPTREVLAQTMTDIGTPQLAEQALHLYDFPLECEEFLREHGHENPESSAEKLPKPALASTIFMALLIESGRIAVIDWADGSEEILDGYDQLLATVGMKRFTQEERDYLTARTNTCKRGESFPTLRDELERMVSERGLIATSLDLGGDAYFPIVLSSAAFARWRDAEFGKGYPVLP